MYVALCTHLWDLLPVVSSTLQTAAAVLQSCGWDQFQSEPNQFHSKERAPTSSSHTYIQVESQRVTSAINLLSIRGGGGDSRRGHRGSGAQSRVRGERQSRVRGERGGHLTSRTRGQGLGGGERSQTPTKPSPTKPSWHNPPTPSLHRWP